MGILLFQQGDDVINVARIPFEQDVKLGKALAAIIVGDALTSLAQLFLQRGFDVDQALYGNVPLLRVRRQHYLTQGAFHLDKMDLGFLEM